MNQIPNILINQYLLFSPILCSAFIQEQKPLSTLRGCEAVSALPGSTDTAPRPRGLFGIYTFWVHVMRARIINCHFHSNLNNQSQHKQLGGKQTPISRLTSTNRKKRQVLLLNPDINNNLFH